MPIINCYEGPMKSIRFFILPVSLISALILSGCPIPEPLPICPGQPDILRSTQILNAQSQAVRPVRATAQPLLGGSARQSLDACC